MSPSPTEQDIRTAARLLTTVYAANRLYLVFHAEIPADDAERVFRWWRRHCPQTVTLVAALVLRMYDKPPTPVFTADQLRRLVEFFQRTINAQHIALYDVYANRTKRSYQGYYAVPFPDIVATYNGLNHGKSPGTN